MPPAMQPIWLLTDTPDLCISGEIHTGLHLHINLPITSHNFITFHFIYMLRLWKQQFILIVV